MKISRLSAVAAVTGSAALIYYVIFGALYSFSRSGLWIWLGFALIMAFACLWNIFIEPRISGRAVMSVYRILKSVCLSLFALFLAVFLLFELCIIGRWIHGCTTHGKSADAVIVLGATVEGDKPGDALKTRILTAYEYLKDKPDAIIIACGGLGEGDVITEADCIKAELTQMGIDGDRILTETRSTSTSENFLFASELIPKDAKRIATVTSGFHQFRAWIIGNGHLNGNGEVTLIPVSARDVSFALPHSMVREFAAFVSDILDGNVSFN